MRQSQAVAPLPGVEFKVPYKRVWVTQGLPGIPPRVALDKTPSISKWKFTIGRLTSSISIIKFEADRAPEESNLIRFI